MASSPLQDLLTGTTDLVGNDAGAIANYLSNYKGSDSGGNTKFINNAGESLQDFANRIVAMGNDEADKSSLAYSAGTELPILAATIAASAAMPEIGAESLARYAYAAPAALRPLAYATKGAIQNAANGIISGLAKSAANGDDSAEDYTLADVLTSAGAGAFGRYVNPNVLAAMANVAGVDDYIRNNFTEDEVND